ncbi:TPA: hypothetical protein I0I31_RS06880, partial [Enterococcus faecium]|nr:hypothetical protein [Enterococcus faecium]EME8223166.1 hypothetical protein [Enterococcus faecium]EMF0387985.1 hypothetical protein [Enterococcus faecium]
PKLKLLLMFLTWLDLLPQMQAFEHRLPRGYEKASLHQVIRVAKLKQLLMFLTWLDLLPQMQAFEHRLPRGYEKGV